LSKKLEIIVDRYNRTRVTNISTEESQRFYDLARAIVVKKIELAIPNSKVIGQGTTYIKVGDKIIEVNIPRHGDTVTDSLLANYTSQYGTKNLHEQFARTVVICHPWALNFRNTVREADYDGKRGSSFVYVAPIAIDDKFIREALSDTILLSHPLAKAVYSGQFYGGMLRLNHSNDVLSPDFTSVPALDINAMKKGANENGASKKKEHPPLLYEGGEKYIWVFTGTDPHEGGRAKEWVRCKKTGKIYGVSDAVFEMLRREGLTLQNRMPVHIFASNDDPTQGQNFKARTQPDPHHMPPWKVIDMSLRLLSEGGAAENKEAVLAQLQKMQELLTQHITKGGTDFPHEQMFQVMERFLAPNVDVFSAILRRAKNSKLAIKGIGEFANKFFDGYDTRNVGFINLGSGNHLAHTVEEEIIEGPFYATFLRNLILRLPEWQKEEKFVEQHVVAPLYSGEAIALGTIKAPNGYEYGLDLRATPPRMSGWADPLLGAVRNDPLRGNYSRIFNGRLTLKTYGDKHFFATVATSYALYHMSASGTHTDRYGERGFPPNNTGVSFIGLPVHGPESGPILLRLMPYDVIRDFMEDNPRPFDWDRFLPNPV